MAVTDPLQSAERLSEFERLYPWPPRAEGRDDIVGTDQLAGHFTQTALQPGGLYDAADAWRQLFRGLNATTGGVEFGKKLADRGRTRGQLVEKALTEVMRAPITAREIDGVFKAIAGQIVMYPVCDIQTLSEERQARVASINQVLEDDFMHAPTYYEPFINTSMLTFADYPGPIFTSTGSVPSDRASVPELAKLDIFTTHFVPFNTDPREDLI